MVSNLYRAVFLFGFSSSCVPYVASFSGFPFFIALSVLSNIYFLDRGLLLARKLLNQGFILIKLKLSPKVLRSPP